MNQWERYGPNLGVFGEALTRDLALLCKLCGGCFMG